jgi:hypothetical protein
MVDFLMTAVFTALLLAAVGLGTFWSVTVAGQDLTQALLLRNGMTAEVAAERAKFAFGIVQTAGGGLGLLCFGPLADRIDMHVAVGAVALHDLSSETPSESTGEIRQRVARARRSQVERYVKLRGVTCNAHVPGRWIDSHGGLDRDARALLHRAAGSLSLSARSYHRVLRVSRTIADIDGDREVRECHVAEALRYRPSGVKS